MNINIRTPRPLVLSLVGVWSLTAALGCTVDQGLDSDADSVVSEAAPGIDQARLESFVDAVVEEQISVGDAEAFLAGLTHEEREALIDIFSDRTGGDLRMEASKPADAPGFSPAAVSGSWTETIENAWTLGIPAGSKFASSYQTSWLCDNDPSDPDWSFYFPFSSTQRGLIRWTSNSVQVYTAFMLAYGGNLLGYGSGTSEARLCIGTNGVAAAGGAANVKANIFIHY